MNPFLLDDDAAMSRAFQLAERGRGDVEPNPPVGAVILDRGGKVVGEGYHQKFGGPHAEIHALKEAGPRAEGGTLFVSLEPCCHEGKTPPCTKAILAAGIRRVVVGTSDPAPHVAGGGIAELRQAGLDVAVGVREGEAKKLIAPFTTLFTKHRPYVHAKWAMTLDGKIASRSGHSQWISNQSSRRIVHELRGRMDGILVGGATARIDDPLLTARPPGPRQAARIVVARQADLPLSSQLVQTAKDCPVLVFAGESAGKNAISQLEKCGVEVFQVAESKHGSIDLSAVLKELGLRQLTNLLVEGGGQILGSFFDAGLIDEVHVFVAPKLVGGADAPSPLGGIGLLKIPNSAQLSDVEIRDLDGDVYIHGRFVEAR